MYLTSLIAFSASAFSFLMVYILKQPVLNILFIVVRIMDTNSAATMLRSRYCPSLRDMSMVSGATGFIDFISYMSAEASSTIFANAVNSIGWSKLILLWMILMCIGIVISLPCGILRNKFKNT